MYSWEKYKLFWNIYNYKFLGLMHYISKLWSTVFMWVQHSYITETLLNRLVRQYGIIVCRSYMLNVPLPLVCVVLLFVCFVSTYLRWVFFTFNWPLTLLSSPLSLPCPLMYSQFSVRSLCTFVNSLSYFTALSLPIFKSIAFPPRWCPRLFPF